MIKSMDYTGNIKSITKDYKTGKPIVTFELNTFAGIEDMQNVKLAIDLKPYKEKRSHNSNSYCWKLITEIADILKANKEDIYLQMLKRYGQSELISVLDEIDVSKFLRYYEQAGESTLNGKLFKHYKVYTGSSEMDSKQMSILIDGIVSEAKELNIPTLEDLEIKEMCKQWGT